MTQIAKADTKNEFSPEIASEASEVCSARAKRSQSPSHLTRQISVALERRSSSEVKSKSSKSSVSRSQQANRQEELEEIINDYQPVLHQLYEEELFPEIEFSRKYSEQSQLDQMEDEHLRRESPSQLPKLNASSEGDEGDRDGGQERLMSDLAARVSLGPASAQYERRSHSLLGRVNQTDSAKLGAEDRDASSVNGLYHTQNSQNEKQMKFQGLLLQEVESPRKNNSRDEVKIVKSAHSYDDCLLKSDESEDPPAKFLVEPDEDEEEKDNMDIDVDSVLVKSYTHTYEQKSFSHTYEQSSQHRRFGGNATPLGLAIKHNTCMSVLANRSVTQFTTVPIVFRSNPEDQDNEQRPTEAKKLGSNGDSGQKQRSNDSANRQQQPFVERTQMIELCDHIEVYTDYNDQADSDNEESKRPIDNFELDPDETIGGYASAQEDLEHSTIEPLIGDSQQPQIVGKKRPRRSHKKRKDGDAVSGAGESKRETRVVTACEHTDRKFYAKGFCKNCYHKKGRTKPAECHPDKRMYANKLCQNCYMKKYGKERRKETKKTKDSVDTGPEMYMEASSGRLSKKNSLTDKEKVKSKRKKKDPGFVKQGSVISDPSAPTLITGHDQSATLIQQMLIPGLVDCGKVVKQIPVQASLPPPTKKAIRSNQNKIQVPPASPQ